MPVEFTYGSDPANSPQDAVRWYCGDTNKKRPLLDDKEIRFAVAEQGNTRLAAAVCCEAVAAKFSSIPNIRVGDISKSFGQVADMFQKRANKLRAEACKRAGVSFPATKISTKQALEDDRTLTRPAFAVGLTDNPFTVQLNAALERFSGAFGGF